MGSSILKLALLGGVGYLLYKYYYSNKELNSKDADVDITKINDGRTIFYGDTKDDYVRGFVLPKNINDIKANKIWVLTKPKEYVFGEKPRSMFEVQLNKQTNRVTYNKNNNLPANSEYIADYDKIKDKLVMNQEYTK